MEPASGMRKLAFKVDGVIARCLAAIGREYRKGEVLFELDGSTQLAALAATEAVWHVAAAERTKVASGVHPHQITSARRIVETLREQLQ